MTTTLAYIPSPPQGVWHLGPVPIRAYAVFIIIGIIAALIVGDRRWAARGGEPGVIYDIALWAVPFGLVGGRLYHVMTDWRTYFGEGGAGFVAALKIWDGGLGIWGAVALGGVGAWIGCRRRGIPLPAFGDAIAPGIVLAQAIGRLGNYFNQELYGRPTTLPWGLEIFYRRDPSGVIAERSLDGVSTGQVATVVHPTFLYELIWDVLVFAALIYVDRRFKIGHGRLFAMYVAGYCVGRFWVELMRSDAATLIAGIRINSFTSTFVFIGAVVYILVAPKGREDPETLAGKPVEPEEEESRVSEVAKELTAVAATSGVVAAATVAADEDRAPGDEAEAGGGGKPPESTEKPDVGDEAAEGEAEPVEPEAAGVEEPEAGEAEEPTEAEAVAEPIEATGPEAAAGEEAAVVDEPGAGEAAEVEEAEAPTEPVEGVEDEEPTAAAEAAAPEAGESEQPEAAVGGAAAVGEEPGVAEPGEVEEAEPAAEPVEGEEPTAAEAAAPEAGESEQPEAAVDEAGEEPPEAVDSVEAAEPEAAAGDEPREVEEAEAPAEPVEGEAAAEPDAAASEEPTAAAEPEAAPGEEVTAGQEAAADEAGEEPPEAVEPVVGAAAEPEEAEQSTQDLEPDAAEAEPVEPEAPEAEDPAAAEEAAEETAEAEESGEDKDAVEEPVGAAETDTAQLAEPDEETPAEARDEKSGQPAELTPIAVDAPTGAGAMQPEASGSRAARWLRSFRAGRRRGN